MIKVNFKLNCTGNFWERRFTLGWFKCTRLALTGSSAAAPSGFPQPSGDMVARIQVPQLSILRHFEAQTIVCDGRYPRTWQLFLTFRRCEALHLRKSPGACVAETFFSLLQRLQDQKAFKRQASFAPLSESQGCCKGPLPGAPFLEASKGESLGSWQGPSAPLGAEGRLAQFRRRNPGGKRSSFHLLSSYKSLPRP